MQLSLTRLVALHTQHGFFLGLGDEGVLKSQPSEEEVDSMGKYD